MRDEALCFLPITEISKLIARREVSPRDLVASLLERIGHIDQRINSFVTVLADSALAAASEAEREITAGRYRGPLHGIPVSVKDVVYVRGLRNTASSHVLTTFVPDFDATVTERLRAAGAILIGKARLWELAMRSEDAPVGGFVRNPWNLDRSPMGSSSGSAAGVAAGLSFASLGTDTGGSLRGPASACGVVGFKPTYGRVSRYGVTPVSWTLDHVGPLTRTVRDCALMMNAIAGHDPRDPTSLDPPSEDFTEVLDSRISGVRIGIPRHLLDGPAIYSECLAAVSTAFSLLEAAAATIHDIALPMMEEGQIAQSIINMAESACVHSDNIKREPSAFGPNNRARIELGHMILATDYLRALQVRAVFQRRLLQAMAEVDVIVMPTSPNPPPDVAEPATWASGHASTLTANNRFRWPFNLAGLPAVSVPCGFAEGLPVGLQIVGKPMDDRTVLKVADAYEGATPWHNLRPKPQDPPRPDA